MLPTVNLPVARFRPLCKFGDPLNVCCPENKTYHRSEVCICKCQIEYTHLKVTLAKIFLPFFEDQHRKLPQVM